MKAVLVSKKGFYFGDPCYVLGDEFYHEVWGGIYEYQDCIVKEPKTGMRFAVHGTAYGDGTYYGSDGNEFGVDSGTLALIPLELVEKRDGIDFGGLYLGAGKAEFSENDGMFCVVLPDGNTFTVNTEDTCDDCDDYMDDADDEMGYDPYLGCYTDEV